MKLYGFTEEKETVAVDFSCSKIAAAEIDPWRLDLFDPDPVVLPEDERQLQFRRVGDISFVYVVEQNTVVVGIHDGVQGACVRANLVSAEERVLQCDNVVPSDLPFAEHYAEYLRQLSCGKALFPRRAAAVEIAGGLLKFRYRDTGFHRLKEMPLCYAGEMFEWCHSKVLLPESINAAFTIFQKWQPIVHGKTIWQLFQPKKPETGLLSGLRQAIWGTKPEAVQVSVGPVKTKELEDAFSVSVHHLETPISIDGVVYHVRRRRREDVGLSPFTWSGAPDNHRDDYSIEDLYSLRPNEVSGTRIALFDCAAGQTRPLYRFRDSERGLRPELSGVKKSSRLPAVDPVEPLARDIGLPGSWDTIRIVIGIPGNMRYCEVALGSTVAEMLRSAGLDATGYQVRINGDLIRNLDLPVVVEDGTTVLLLKVK